MNASEWTVSLAGVVVIDNQYYINYLIVNVHEQINYWVVKLL